MTETRTDWTREEIAALFDLPFDELMWEAQGVHRRHHARGEVQLCTLLSIKTGGCAEDCGYCSQSAHARSGLKAEKLMDVEAVRAAAAEARAAGSGRFCMGAAWRAPKDRDMDTLCEMVAGVKAMGLETCMTLGMLTRDQADRLYNESTPTWWIPGRYYDLRDTWCTFYLKEIEPITVSPGFTPHLFTCAYLPGGIPGPDARLCCWHVAEPLTIGKGEWAYNEVFVANEYRAKNPTADIRVLNFDPPMTHYGHLELPRQLAAAHFSVVRWLVRPE